MIHLFHGENTTASRDAYRAAVDRAKQSAPNAECVVLSGVTLTETTLIEALEAQSLFGGDKIICIEGLFSRRVSKEKTDIIEQLVDSTSNTPPLTLLLWESKLVTPSVLKKLSALKHCAITEFKLSKTLFKFLDALQPGNAKTVSTLFASTIETEAPELVMFFMIRRITQLLLAKSKDSKALSGIYSDWQKTQLAQQASTWTIEKLIKMHKKLLDIDLSIKDGSSCISLAPQLDILCASL